jgi:hypothetical protein
MPKTPKFVNVFKQTRYTDLTIIANDADAFTNSENPEDGNFHISLYMLTHYSGHWRTHFDDLTDPLEYVINLDYPAWLISAWLDAWHPTHHHELNPHYEYIEHLMPIYLKYGMDVQLQECYKKFKTLSQYTPGLIKLIFGAEPFKHLEQYFIDNILMNQNVDVPVEWLRIIPMEIVATVLQMKNSMLCSLNSRF